MKKLKNPTYFIGASSFLATLAGLILMLLLGLTVADVISRNFFDSSILGMVEISTLLMVGVAFFGLAQAESNGRHVSLGLLEERLSFRMRHALAWLRILILSFLGGVMVWGISETVFSAISRGETTNDVLALPTWPAKLTVLASFAMFLMLAIARELVRANNNKKGVEASYDDL